MESSPSVQTKIGRPSVITPEVVALLVGAFENGANISEACLLAKVSRDSYYEALKRDPVFADRMESAQNEPVLAAKRTLLGAIRRGDERSAAWYLERKRKEEFAQRTELTGAEGTPLGYVYSSDIQQIKTEEPKQLQ